MKTVQNSARFPEAMEFEHLTAASEGAYYTTKLYAIKGFVGIFRRVKRSATGTKIARPEAVLCRWTGGTLIELVRSPGIDLELKEAGLEVPQPPKDSGVPPSRPLGERSLFDGPVKQEPDPEGEAGDGNTEEAGEELKPLDMVDGRPKEVKEAEFRIMQAATAGVDEDEEDKRLVDDYYRQVERKMEEDGTIPTLTPAADEAAPPGGLSAAELLRRSKQPPPAEEATEEKPAPVKRGRRSAS